MRKGVRSIEERLQELEDRLAIYQVICGYGYAVDGCNAEEVGSCYTEDGIYAIGDYGNVEGRNKIADITRWDDHLKLVNGGCAHMSTLPYVVIAGDRAIATCHTMVPMHGENGYLIGRLSASRLELARQPDGDWKILHRQNYLQDGSPEGPAMLARLKEGPA